MIDPKLTKLCNEGNIELYNGETMTRLGEAIGNVMTAEDERYGTLSDIVLSAQGEQVLTRSEGNYHVSEQ